MTEQTNTALRSLTQETGVALTNTSGSEVGIFQVGLTAQGKEKMRDALGIPKDFEMESSWAMRQVISTVRKPSEERGRPKDFPEPEGYKFNHTYGEERYIVEGTMYAEGGQAKVYRAWDIHLKKIVAVKILDFAGIDEGQVEYFKRGFEMEAKVTDRAGHAPPIYDYFETDDVPKTVSADTVDDGKVPVIVMEFEDSKNWESLTNKIEQGIPKDEAIRILKEVAKIVDTNAKKNIIHRDLKPSNILVMGEMVRILDYGMATGVVVFPDGNEPMGTPQYIPPEQLYSGAPDPKSEIYKLGLIACELLFQKNPQEEGAKTVDDIVSRVFHGNVSDMAVDLVKEKYGETSAVTRRLSSVFTRVLDKDLRNRYNTGKQFVEELAVNLWDA